MAQHDEHPDLQAFHTFVRKSIAYAVVDPNSDARRSFISIDTIKAYFEEDGTSRLRNVLAGVWFPEEPRVDPDDVLENYIAIFSILVELGRGKYVRHFASWDLSDLRLPLDPGSKPPANFPIITDDAQFYQTFCEAQWKYCASVFRYPLNDVHFEDQRILPFVSKELISSIGGSATLYKIRFHPSYNKLDRQKSCSTDHEANTYALKTYNTPDAAQYFENEVSAFRRLRRSQIPSLIGFYGSFIQGNTFNIILEYADRNTLEHYFSDVRAPAKALDIVAFWEGLFDTILALKCIHDVDEQGNVDGPQVLYGFQQDVKPVNILVVSNGATSSYNWKFKLADLGLSHFQKVASGRGSVFANDAHGTRTYGAPECYRGDRYTDQGKIKIEQRVDVWSLGCIFSEAAVWIALGYEGLLEFRERRSAATEDVEGFRQSDCFHDGQALLPVVRVCHAEALPAIRHQIDKITESVINLVETDMLVAAQYRSTAHQLWGKTRTILHKAKHQREQTDGGPAEMAVNVSMRTSPRQPPESPPSSFPPPRHQSRVADSTPTKHSSRPPFHGESSSQHPQTLPDARREHSPDRMSTYDDQILGRKSSPRHPRPATRPTQHSHSTDHAIYSRHHPRSGTITSGNEFDDAQTRRLDAGTSRQKYAAQPRDHGDIPIRQENPGTGAPHGPRHSLPALGRGSSDSYLEAGYLDFDIRQSHMHHSHSIPERRETTSSTATGSTQDYEPPPVPVKKKISPATVKAGKRAKKSKRGRTTSPTGPKPNLTVGEALHWKSEMRFYNRKFLIRMGSPPELPHGYLRDRLESRDHAFLIDNSSSMADHWVELTSLLGVLAYLVKPFDEDGLEMFYTISSPNSVKSKDSTKLIKSVAKTKPAGISDISIRLSSILEAYKAKIHDAFGAGSKLTSRARKDVRKFNLYVLTDGVWQPKCDAEAPIKNLVRKLLELNLGEKQVGIQFIRFGSNPQGVARLQKLDNEIFIKGSENQLDIVDTEPSNGNVWKMLLGAIDQYFDSSGDEDNNEDSDEGDFALSDEEKPRTSSKGKGVANGY